MLFLTPVLWGATFPAAKLALETLSPLTFMAWSRLLGLVSVVAALPIVARGLNRSSVAAAAGPGLLLGSLIFVAYSLQTLGLQLSTATNAGFITGLYVVFTPILGLLLFKEPTTRAIWVAVTFSVVGLALLSTASLTSFDPRLGDLLVLASALAWAAHVVAVGRFAPRLSGMALALAQMAAASVLHVLVAVPGGLDAGGASSVWPLLVVTGILGSGIAYTLQLLVQKQIDATRAVVVLAGESLASALLSALWIGERLAWHQWVGAGFVVAAMVVSELKARAGAPVRLEPSSAA